MSSAAKTLSLLSYFTAERPEISLSQFYRLTKRDKATTYRHLQALEGMGFVEKNSMTKRYRLGPAILQLAQLRETTVPRKAGVKGPLQQLANGTGETAHASVLSGATLFYLDSIESPRHSVRAIVDLHTLPLHATASGICALAFGSPSLTDIAKENMESFTAQTATTEEGLDVEIRQAKKIGFGHIRGGLEDGIYGLAAPVFDQTGGLAGTVSVASVASRFTPESERVAKRCLMLASHEISRNWGGTVPRDIEECWMHDLSLEEELEQAS
ncbi:MAG: IclR family transcriptional regulator [Rhizobiaceae bacterium]